MVPNIVHFVYVGGRPFSLVHYLAVRTAAKVNRPEQILFHHTVEPDGPWWEKARKLVTLHRVAPVGEIFGNPVRYPAHQADVVRLRMLRRYGGVYLDLDVVSINPLAPLRHHPFVMGIEPGVGLCNAVILAQADSPFLETWFESYRDFDATQWNRHSVQRPWELAHRMPGSIHVESPYAFFYPSHNDPVHHYLWGERPPAGALVQRMAKAVAKSVLGGLRQDGGPALQRIGDSLHGLRGAEWHFARLAQSYCLHLWEGLWGERYLSRVDPDFLLHDGSQFARIVRRVLGEEELRALLKTRRPVAHSTATPRASQPFVASASLV